MQVFCVLTILIEEGIVGIVSRRQFSLGRTLQGFAVPDEYGYCRLNDMSTPRQVELSFIALSRNFAPSRCW